MTLARRHPRVWVDPDPIFVRDGKRTSASFLYNATRTMYERLGFSYERSKGKGNQQAAAHLHGMLDALRDERT